MSHRPPWTPRVESATLKRDGAAKREPLSVYYKQLPEQIGFFILREVRGLSDQEVAAYARRVRAEEAAWPAPSDWRVRSPLHARACVLYVLASKKVFDVASMPYDKGT